MPEKLSDEYRRFAEKIGRDNAWAYEQEARECFEYWLPRALRRLVDHPKLLRWYMRLPHRRRPMMVEFKETGYRYYTIK